MQQKELHKTNRVGREDDRRQYFRRDANCPVVITMTTRPNGQQFKIIGLLVNISEQGCLITSAAFPWRNNSADTRNIEERRFPPVSERVQIHLPWTDTNVGGVLKEQGKQTLRVQLTSLLPSDLVDRIARMKPARNPNT